MQAHAIPFAGPPMLIRPRIRHARAGGLTLIEVSLSLAIVAVLMLAAVSAFSSNVGAVNRSKAITSASIFVEATLENLDAQNVDALLAMNGDRLFDAEDADSSSYGADLTVFLAAANLVQVEVDLVDLRSERPMGKIVVLKARR